MSFHQLQRWLFFWFFVACGVVSTDTDAQILLKPPFAASGSNVVVTPYVRAELVAQAPDGVGLGKPLWLGLLLEHQPGWHTYWKNPGDSGLPTQLQWTLPLGMDAGEIAWPVPRKIPTGHLANYGYEGKVLLPVALTVSPDFRAGPLERQVTIGLHASWLVCRQECIPEEGSFTLSLPLQSTTALHAAAFAAAAQAHPETLVTGLGSSAQVQPDGQTLTVQVTGLPAALQGQTLEVFAEMPDVLETAAQVVQQWQGQTWQAQLALSPRRSASPDSIALVLAHEGRGWQLLLPLQGGWPQQAPTQAPVAVPLALEAALRANSNEAKGTGMDASVATLSATTPIPAALWLAALGAALLGGALLNLMPCVFPVLAIKVMGFARHAQDRHSRRIGALAYAAGVVLSFVLLGLGMLTLRAAGEAVGWGFQLQSPVVVVLLAALFALIGLNLAGVFEVASVLPSSLANAQARHPVVDAFLTGVLAVAVASPCTAPFMGASLGLTATLPAGQALSIFVALGLGLALPYLLVCWLPGFARALPRPGMWMDSLRRALAFPMFATVVWLIWVLGQQSGIDAVAVLLALLVMLSMLVWALTLPGRARWVFAPTALASCFALVWFWGAKMTQLPHGGKLQDAVMVEAGQLWQPWRADLPGQLLAQGRPVFVDYTAAWCVTCQYNKQTALADARVLGDFAAKNVALLRADWTRRDAAITAALAQLGRSGVPVYVLHAPGRAPVVLSEILSVRELRAAVAAL